MDSQKCPFCGNSYKSLDVPKCPTCGYKLSEYNRNLKELNKIEKSVVEKPQEPGIPMSGVIGMLVGAVCLSLTMISCVNEAEKVAVMILALAILAFSWVANVQECSRKEYNDELKKYNENLEQIDKIKKRLGELRRTAKEDYDKIQELKHEGSEMTTEIRVKNTSAEEYSGEQSHTNTIERDELRTNRIVSTGSFGDALKASARTQEDYQSKQDNRLRNEARKNAGILYEEIKGRILDEVSKGHYNLVYNQKLVDYNFRLSSAGTYDIWEFCRRYEKGGSIKPSISNSQIMLQQMTGKSERECRKIARQYRYDGSTTVKREEITYTYALIENNKVRWFFEALKKLGDGDCIEIIPGIYDEETKIFHNLPFEVKCLEPLNNVMKEKELSRYKFSARCRCVIPDEYSTDSSVTITTAEEIQNSGEEVSSNKISIDMMEGHDFEYFCANVIEKNGYSRVEVTRGSGDQGIDIIAYRDGVKYGIQCKRQSNDVGNKAVQEAFSGKIYYNCHVGVVLTNRYFTPSAVDLAESNGIILWDRAKLLTMIKVAGIQVE